MHFYVSYKTGIFSDILVKRTGLCLFFFSPPFFPILNQINIWAGLWTKVILGTIFPLCCLCIGEIWQNRWLVLHFTTPQRTLLLHLSANSSVHSRPRDQHSHSAKWYTLTDYGVCVEVVCLNWCYLVNLSEVCDNDRSVRQRLKLAVIE